MLSQIWCTNSLSIYASYHAVYFNNVVLLVVVYFRPTIQRICVNCCPKSTRKSQAKSMYCAYASTCVRKHLCVHALVCACTCVHLINVVFNLPGHTDTTDPVLPSLPEDSIPESLQDDGDSQRTHQHSQCHG